ncbi:PREDICTED: putative receptor-like protein kinase At4g00960 isoform X2 [Tarenaya hassleriana]|uniref:putative receptor-like protein kinase At4g00960 isoform X2 n=1 Tax=Tarenaya hassleriana TaxID=28532 RepID=UPI00053C0CA2|nr:PREDICTED: putative receptor-like protein kinase At4g00960 isoform X2 [Tarenaya hassleriana]
MTKSMNFIQGLIKPFKRGSNRGVGEDDIERIAALEQKVFPFQVLVSATKDFHPKHKLGEGGFGPVYKGRLSDGREIAVKKLSQASRQGKNEFVNEAKLLAKVQHRNVVNLLGYCTHGDDKLLVYEYVSNESLDKVLFKSNRRAELDWKQRVEIISGIARGLLYLHEDAPNCIIHRDIKAGNILLDDKWVPKIADFGMARLFPEDQTHVNTRVAGTNGYMAPEYVMHGVLSVKADVFSFGVVVLELISGQKNSSFSLRHPDQTLLEWAYRLYKKGRSMEMVDPVMAETADPEQVKLCAQIGLLCVQGDPQQRPSMRRIALLLSRKPGHLEEEPARPGVPGSRYRRRSHAGTSSAGTTSTARSSTDSFGSNLKTDGGGNGRSSPTASATPTWSPETRTTASDSRGKRRLWSY